MKKWVKCSLLGVLGLALAAGISYADDDDEGEEHNYHRGKGYEVVSQIREMQPVTHAKWKTECSSCHMLYLPGLLPARSWNKMMGTLENHFGENAVLEDPAKKEITDFLVQNAADKSPNRRSQKIASSIPANDTPLAFSQTYYFKRKHHEIADSVYKRKAIGSAANCIACHKGAEQGNFNEEAVRIPK